MQADAIVTSGFAKIELVFLDASGNWLTNNTLPLGGIAATSTTGSIQFLSAIWQAPENTESMIIRLINNVSSGSARFDLVRVTNWESPIQPYGSEPYYPDEMTGRTGHKDSAGVMARQDNGSPDTLTYSGNFKRYKAFHYGGGCCHSVAQMMYITSTKKSHTFFSGASVLYASGDNWGKLFGRFTWSSRTNVDLGKDRVRVTATGPKCFTELYVIAFLNFPTPNWKRKCLHFAEIWVEGSDGYFRYKQFSSTKITYDACCFKAKGGVKVQTMVMWWYR